MFTGPDSLIPLLFTSILDLIREERVEPAAYVVGGLTARETLLKGLTAALQTLKLDGEFINGGRTPLNETKMIRQGRGRHAKQGAYRPCTCFYYL